MSGWACVLCINVLTRTLVSRSNERIHYAEKSVLKGFCHSFQKKTYNYITFLKWRTKNCNNLTVKKVFSSIAFWKSEWMSWYIGVVFNSYYSQNMFLSFCHMIKNMQFFLSFFYEITTMLYWIKNFVHNLITYTLHYRVTLKIKDQEF